MTATLLLAFDGSPGAQRACRLIAAFGGARDALDVRVLSVQPAPLRLWPDAGLDHAAIERALVAAAHSTADAALARLLRGVSARAAVAIGPPADAIIEEARTAQVDAIVMGTRGRGALRGFPLGSVALRVAQNGAVPTVLVSPRAVLPRAFGRGLRVLAASDGSPPALRAVETLAAWQPWLGEVAVELVHVQPALSLVETILPPHDDALAHWSGVAAERATEAARELLDRAGIPHRTHAATGDPAPEIARIAAATGCEWLALGTRGLGAAHHALLGSVALRTVVLSPVPVLLVP